MDTRTVVELLEQFQYGIEVGSKRVRANFVVLKEKGRLILGYQMAKELEVLKIKLRINEVVIK